MTVLVLRRGSAIDNANHLAERRVGGNRDHTRPAPPRLDAKLTDQLDELVDRRQIQWLRRLAMPLHSHLKTGFEQSKLGSCPEIQVLVKK